MHKTSTIFSDINDNLAILVVILLFKIFKTFIHLAINAVLGFLILFMANSLFGLDAQVLSKNLYLLYIFVYFDIEIILLLAKKQDFLTYQLQKDNIC